MLVRVYIARRAITWWMAAGTPVDQHESSRNSPNPQVWKVLVPKWNGHACPFEKKTLLRDRFSLDPIFYRFLYIFVDFCCLALQTPFLLDEKKLHSGPPKSIANTEGLQHDVPLFQTASSCRNIYKPLLISGLAPYRNIYKPICSMEYFYPSICPKSPSHR